MDFLLLFLAVAFATLLIVSALITWGIVRTARTAKRHARRVRIRLADSLPAATFGNQLWWQATRIDRAFEKTEYARRATSGSPFADDVLALAAQLQAGADELRVRVKAVAGLSGVERGRELERIEPQIKELEAGATALVNLTDRVTRLDNLDNRDVGAGESVRRRAEAIHNAIDELASLEAPRTETFDSVFDTGDADPGTGLVSGVERDEQGGERLERGGVVEPPGVDRS